MIGEHAILSIHRKERLVRDCQTELLKLLRERPGEVEVPTETQLIPPVTPPLILIKYFIRLFRRIDRNNRFSGQIRFAMVETEIVTEEQATLEATIGTVLRGWDRLLLAGKHRRNFFVEGEVGWGDFEECRALEAGLLHAW